MSYSFSAVVMQLNKRGEIVESLPLQMSYSFSAVVIAADQQFLAYAINRFK